MFAVQRHKPVSVGRASTGLAADRSPNACWSPPVEGIVGIDGLEGGLGLAPLAPAPLDARGPSTHGVLGYLSIDEAAVARLQFVNHTSRRMRSQQRWREEGNKATRTEQPGRWKGISGAAECRAGWSMSPVRCHPYVWFPSGIHHKGTQTKRREAGSQY